MSEKADVLREMSELTKEMSNLVASGATLVFRPSLFLKYLECIDSYLRETELDELAVLIGDVNKDLRRCLSVDVRDKLIKRKINILERRLELQMGD